MVKNPALSSFVGVRQEIGEFSGITYTSSTYLLHAMTKEASVQYVNKHLVCSFALEVADISGIHLDN